MANYLCNPLNVDYRYQFHDSEYAPGKKEISREAADPSLILFKGTYYLFASMTLEVWTSDDLVHWSQHRLPDNLPLYDYAPDVRAIGDYVYFCASKRGEICDFYRTKDVLEGPYEKFEGTFDFWDPDLFPDDDGRLYFYWGCSNSTPIWGAELDPETMRRISDPVPLISDHADRFGFERSGEDNSTEPCSEEEAEAALQKILKEQGRNREDIPAGELGFMKALQTHRPFIEGAWMTKYKGKYYLQYACPGTEYNIYADAVYESDSPLGPFAPAKNNPYSLKAGGFLPGAGHGSTMEDRNGNFWHTATMRISKNHNFERRVGIWPAGFDEDGVLFCDQRFGDWPLKLEDGRMRPWQNPEWYLLSYQKETAASSAAKNHPAAFAADENVQSWWKAATNQPGEWIRMDLGKTMDVRAVQINFADDRMDVKSPGKISGGTDRYIDEGKHATRWLLEGSNDGEAWFTLTDKSDADTNLPHDFLVWEKGKEIRFLKLTVFEVPFGQNACVSGLRVFGKGGGNAPAVPSYEAERSKSRDMLVSIAPQKDVTGYVILWGFKPDKLYHSRLTFQNSQAIGSLIAGEDVYLRVIAFNESGITEGKEILHLKAK